MMRKATLLVLAAALLLFSGEGFYRAVRGRVAVDATCEDLVRGGLPAPRVRVTGCNIFYGGIGYRGRNGAIDELYLPVQPPDAQGMPARIVISSRDAGALAIAGRVLGAGPVTTREQSLEAMQKVVAHLGLTTEFTGLARTGSIDRLRSRRILSGLPVAVADNAVILDLNGAPDFLRPVIALMAGGLLALLAFWPLHRQSRTAVAAGTSAPPASHETRVRRSVREFRAASARPRSQAPLDPGRAAAAPAARAGRGERARRHRDGAAARLEAGGHRDSCRCHPRSGTDGNAERPGAARRIGPDSISACASQSPQRWSSRAARPAWRSSRKSC